MTLSNRNQMILGTILVLLVLATRGQHFATLHNLPGASWSVFFLIGVYLSPLWVLPAMLVFVWGVDFLPHLTTGASVMSVISEGKAFCLTPAYLFLLPAYTALWYAGRWYARQYRFEWHTLLPLAAAVFTGAVACELLSSGGFYLFSGHFDQPTLAEFMQREAQYFAGYLQSMLFYISLAAMLHTLITQLSNTTRKIAYN